jgi:hypothetical protein
MPRVIGISDTEQCKYYEIETEQYTEYTLHSFWDLLYIEIKSCLYMDHYNV